MSELQIFNNTEFGSVRSLMVNCEPYFIAKDIALRVRKSAESCQGSC
ncbi:hypothetical protein SAMN06296386_1084 [Lachnospiraceae bacterium]|nr:hypothetical protein SAMN06296386_1084 [Lachnospiraceae bacterium]